MRICIVAALISHFFRFQTPTMSLISAFLKQTIYMGMPDDSVRNSVVLFQLQKPRETVEIFISLEEALAKNEYDNTELISDVTLV